MALDQRKYERKHTDVLRDIRPAYVRVAEWAGRGSHAGTVFFMTAFAVYQFPNAIVAGDDGVRKLIYGKSSHEENSTRMRAPARPFRDADIGRPDVPQDIGMLSFIFPLV